jgi:predicted metal-dependent phosphoesterase TrpH
MSSGRPGAGGGASDGTGRDGGAGSPADGPDGDPPRRSESGGRRRVDADAGRGGTVGRFRTLRIDPHVHTADSYDCRTSVETVLERASVAGLDGLVVTDHDEIDASRRAVDLAPDYGLVALPGVEVSTADGHLLALGVDGVPDPGASLAATARRVHDLGGVAVVPHPFQRWRHGARRAALEDARLDAVEVYNAHTLTGFRNGQARTYAESRGLPGVGGSDAHAPSLVGRAHTVVRVPRGRERDPEAVLDAIGAGRTAVRGRRTTTRQYLKKYVTNVGLRTASVR